MSSCISYEFFQSKQGMPNGIATLDKDGKIPFSQLPDFDNPVAKTTTIKTKETFKGKYVEIKELISSNEEAQLADYAYVYETKSYWYWNEALAKWVNENISESAYNTLKDVEKDSIPYIVGP